MNLSTSLNEYLLVIEIPKNITTKIETVRNTILQQYKITQPKTGKPTLVLARFVLPIHVENSIKYLLHHIIIKENTFSIHLKNFNGYPMHCLYITIENQYLLLNLIDKIKGIRNHLKMPQEKPYFLQDPIVPLVAKINKDVYIQAMNEYTQKTFFESFKAEQILLLRRKNGAEKFTIAHSFSLNKISTLRNLQFT